MSREHEDGLKCPACGKGRLFVKDTRGTAGYIRRRRECKDCGHRATSYELIDQTGDPAGTKVGDIVQLRTQMMKLPPEMRVVVRRMIVFLADAGGTKSPPEVAHSVPLTDANGPPDDCPTEETMP